MTPFRLDDADAFARLLRHPPADAREQLRELIRDCLPPFHMPPYTGDGPRVDGTEWLLDRLADAVRLEAGTLGAILAGRGEGDRSSRVQVFARRFRVSWYLWAFGFRPFGQLAADTDPDLGELAATLHRTRAGPTSRLNVRSLIGTKELLTAVIRRIGPVREISDTMQWPFAGCDVTEVASRVPVPLENTLTLWHTPLLRSETRLTLGGSARLGGVATVANARVRITVEANPSYFEDEKGLFASGITAWERALAAAEWWAVRLVPAAVQVEWRRRVGHDRATRLAERVDRTKKTRTAFALNCGLRLK